MKKIKSLILLPLLGSLTLGLVSISNNKKAESVDASSMNLSSGMFVRVDDYGDIGIGSDVIFVSDDGYALDDVWGNPAFVHGSTQGVQFGNGGKTVTLTNSKATIFHVEEGTETRTYNGESQGSYAFRADVMSISGERKTNVYFAHNEDERAGGRNEYSYIERFKDYDIAVQQSLIKESSWYLDFSTEEYSDGVKILTHIRNCKNYESDHNTELGFTHRYSDLFCSGGTRDVYIYRQFSESEYNVHVYQNPTKTEYSFGENIDLSGLKIILNSPLHDDELITYNDSTKNDFSFPETAYGSDTIQLQCYYKGFKFVVSVDVTKQDFLAYKIGELPDYRGSYMLVCEEGYVFNPESYSAKTSCEKARSTINYNNDKGGWDAGNGGAYSEYELKLTKDSSGFHLKSNENYYLDLDAFKMTNTSTPVVFIENTSSGVRIKNSSGQYFNFEYWNFEYVFSMGGKDDNEPVVLCKYPAALEEKEEFDDYLDEFLEATDVCDAAGSSFHITQTAWNNLATSFNALDDTVQAMFVNITYNLSDIEIRSKEHAMSRYDYIYQKYHSTYAYIADFIGRSSIGTMQSVYSGSNNVLFTTNNSDSAVLLITITALCSVTSIGVLLIIKKRKAIK